MTEAEFYNVVFYNSGQPLPLMKKHERPWLIHCYMLCLKVMLFSVSSGKFNRNLEFHILSTWFEKDAIFR